MVDKRQLIAVDKLFRSHQDSRRYLGLPPLPIGHVPTGDHHPGMRHVQVDFFTQGHRLELLGRFYDGLRRRVGHVPYREKPPRIHAVDEDHA